MLKENELGISKIKELMLKLETAQKQIKDLSKKIEEKNKIINELKEEIKKIKIIKPKFNTLEIETNLNKVEIIGLLLCNKNLDETLNTLNNSNLNLEEENKILKFLKIFCRFCHFLDVHENLKMNEHFLCLYYRLLFYLSYRNWNSQLENSFFLELRIFFLFFGINLYNYIHLPFLIR